MKRFVFVFVLLSFGCESAEVKTGSDLVPQSEDTSTPSSDDGGPSTPDGGSDGESDDGGTTDGSTTDGAPEDTSASDGGTDDTAPSATDTSIPSTDTSASGTDTGSPTDTSESTDTSAPLIDSGDTGSLGGGGSTGSTGGTTAGPGDSTGGADAADGGTTSGDGGGSIDGGDADGGGSVAGDGGSTSGSDDADGTGDAGGTDGDTDATDSDPPAPGVDITTLCVTEPDPLDLDCDGLSNEEELDWGTDPENPDTDGDWVIDSDDNRDGRLPTRPELLQVTLTEGATDSYRLYRQLQKQTMDVAFLLDTTCSMSATAEALANEFTSMVSDLEAGIGTTVAIRYGFATYDDYAYGTFGSPEDGDKPFILRNAITNDVGAVLREMESVDIHAGADGPESTVEALFQGLTGIGYDQNCDGTYNAATDIAPFVASPRDIFSGDVSIIGSLIPSDDDTDLVTPVDGFSSVTSTGGGLTGGFGFNSWSQPVIVYATDNELRDPEDGYAVPGGCPSDAGSTDVVDAASELNARLIGIASGSSVSDTVLDQMTRLAERTNSMYDSTSDGVADAPLVYSWSSDRTDEFRGLLVDALTNLATSEGTLSTATRFDSVSAQVTGDTEGFVSGIDSPTVTDVDLASTPPSAIDFGLNFEGVVTRTAATQVHDFNIVLVGDDGTEMNTLPIQIVVPGLSSDADGDMVEWSEDCDDTDPFIGAVINDYDCDGVIRAEDCDDTDPTSTIVAEDEDCDGVITAKDCDDTSSDVGLITEDADCDGIDMDIDCDDSDPESTSTTIDADCDGILTEEDCDDSDPSTVNDMDCDGWMSDVDCNEEDPEIHPGATDFCDGIDNDCDEEIDEEEDLDFYPDTDSDGFGDPDGETVKACIAPTGYTFDNTDCDDADRRVHPDVVEQCNGFDDNCDGEIDEDLDRLSFYLDADRDGFGSASEILACEAPPNHVDNDDDCDDDNPLARPDVATDCRDEVDNDCDGEVDEGPFDSVFFADTDGDGFGNPDLTMAACEPSDGWVTDNTDCDDTARDVFPGAKERCTDGIDNDCNGAIDDVDEVCTCPDLGYVAKGDLGSSTGDVVARGSTIDSDDDYSSGTCGNEGGRDDFYRFTAPENGCYTFDTNGSAYDTVLHLLEPCEGESLACDDDDGESTRSMIEQFAMNGGDEVLVAIDGFNERAAGDYVLNINYTAYGADGFGELPILRFDTDLLDETGFEFFEGSTAGLANTYDSACGDSDAADAALLWTAPSTGRYVFDTVGSEFDTILSLYDADRSLTDAERCDDDAAEALTCNDDAVDFGLSSEIVYDVIAGEQYVIVIDGYGSWSGDYMLTIYER